MGGAATSLDAATTVAAIASKHSQPAKPVVMLPAAPQAHLWVEKFLTIEAMPAMAWVYAIRLRVAICTQASSYTIACKDKALQHSNRARPAGQASMRF